MRCVGTSLPGQALEADFLDSRNGGPACVVLGWPLSAAVPGTVTHMHTVSGSESLFTSVAVRGLLRGIVSVALIRRKGMGQWSIAAY